MKKFSLKVLDKDLIRLKIPGFFLLTCCDCGMKHMVAIEPAKV